MLHLCILWQVSFFPVSIDLMKRVSINSRTRGHTRRPQRRCLKKRPQKKQNLLVNHEPLLPQYKVSVLAMGQTRISCKCSLDLFLICIYQCTDRDYKKCLYYHVSKFIARFWNHMRQIVNTIFEFEHMYVTFRNL